MEIYNRVLFKDKSDIDNEYFDKLFTGSKILGAMQKNTMSNQEKKNIKILSVKFSKVGAKTLTDYPNLRTIICRSHGFDNVNMNLTNKKNIRVVTTNPYTNSCVDYLMNYGESFGLKDSNIISIFGVGTIGYALYLRIRELGYKPYVYFIDSKTKPKEIRTALEKSEIAFITLPLNEKTKNYFNYKLIGYESYLPRIVSISRGEIFNNIILLDLLISGRLKSGVFDILSKEKRNEIIDNYDVTYTGHSSWNVFPQDTMKYMLKLKTIVDYELIE